MSKFYDPYDNVFKDGKLTQLMIIEKSGKAQQPRRLDYPIYSLLSSFLSDYGIHISGAVMIGDYQVRSLTINSGFDTTNEPILKELYAFTSGSVNLQLSTKIAQHCAFAFNYDLQTYKCTFQKYVHGRTVESLEFKSLKQMLAYLRDREADNG